MDSGIYGYCRVSDNKVIYIDKSVDIMHTHAQHLFPHTYGKSEIEKKLQEDPEAYYLKIFTRCPISFLEQEFQKYQEQYATELQEEEAKDEADREPTPLKDTEEHHEKTSVELIDEFGGIEFLKTQKARGLSQKEIAERFGYNYGTIISNYVKKKGYRWSDL